MKIKNGDLVKKINGFGANILTGLVIGVSENKTVVFTDGEIDNWITKFVKVINK